MNRKSFLFFIFCMLVMSACVAGCSGADDNPSATGLNNRDFSGEFSATMGNKALWGIYNVIVDSDSWQAEIEPARSPAFRVDVVTFLQPPKGSLNNIGIKVTDVTNWISDGLIDVEVSLAHPFPGLDEYSGFDVMGVFVGGGNIQGEHDPGIYLPDIESGAVLLNADGYTRWYNPVEWGWGDSLFHFTEGTLGTGSGFDAILNGYRYFADGLGKEDLLSGFFSDPVNCENRGAFTPTTLHRTYELKFPMVSGKPKLEFQYAVVAGWEQPDKSGPVEVPDSFPEDANAAEPIVTGVENNSNMYFDGTSGGGFLRLDIEILDWNAYLNATPVSTRISDIYLESPTGLFPAVDGVFEDMGALTWESSGPASSTVGLEIAVTPSDNLDQDILVTIVSADPVNYDSGGPGWPENAELAGYYRLQVPVPSEGGQALCTPPVPEFSSRTTGTTYEIFTENPENPAGHTLEYEWDVTVYGVAPSWPGYPTGGDNTYDVDWSGVTGGTDGDYTVHVRVHDMVLDAWSECSVDVTVDPAPDHPWPMMGHDYHQTGRSEYTGPSSMNQKWSYDTGGAIVDSMAVDSDGTVYLGSCSDSIYAINSSGGLVWSHATSQDVKSAPALGPDNELYIGSNEGHLFCFDRTNGDIIWQEDLGTPILGGVTVLPDGWVGVGCWDERYRMFSWDGSVVTEEWYINTGHIVSGTAAYYDEKLFIPSWDSNLYCVDPSDGSIIWQWPSSGVLATGMAINDDGVCFIGNQSGIVRALDLTHEPSYLGFVVWTRYVTGGARSACSLLPDGDVIVGTLSGYLYRLDDVTGDIVWSNDYGAQIVGASAVDAEGKVYFGNYNGNFYCIDGTSTSSPPTLLWQTYLGTSGSVGVAAAPAIGSDGTVFIGSSTGPVHAFEVQ